MKTLEQIYEEVLLKHHKIQGFSAKRVAIDAMKEYGNQQLESASDIALEFEKEIISEKILSLQDEVSI